MGFAVIGPRTDVCNSGGATKWGIQRYQWFVEESGGLYMDIAEKTEDDECVVADFSQALEELGTLLNSLLDVFPLQSVPDVSTIKVFVDGDEVVPSPETLNADTGENEFGSGWRYLAAENGVQFVGDAIPDYNSDVRIFYRPLDGMPRGYLMEINLSSLTRFGVPMHRYLGAITLSLCALASNANAQETVDIGVIKNSERRVVQKLLYPKEGVRSWGFILV